MWKLVKILKQKRGRETGLEKQGPGGYGHSLRLRLSEHPGRNNASLNELVGLRYAFTPILLRNHQKVSDNVRRLSISYPAEISNIFNFSNPRSLVHKCRKFQDELALYFHILFYI